MSRPSPLIPQSSFCPSVSSAFAKSFPAISLCHFPHELKFVSSTDLNQALRDDPKKKAYYENKVMLKRIGHPDEQAGMVLLYLSDHASCHF